MRKHLSFSNDSAAGRELPSSRGLVAATLGLGVCLGASIGAKSALAAPLTPGDVVIYRVGDGQAALVNTGSPVFLDEYSPTGTLVQSIALPTAQTGNNKPVFASGTATSEGFLTRSADGQSLFLSGYGATAATSLSGTTGAAVPRVVVKVDAAGSVDSSTGLADFASGNNPRTVVSPDGTNFYAAGGAGGVRYAKIGDTTSTQITAAPANIRQLNIFDGNLFGSSGAAGFRLFQVGTGLPTTTGATSTNLPGISNSTGSPYAFVLLDLSAAVPGSDTLYVADDSATGGGILKYSLVGGSFTLNGTITAASARGLTASVSGTGNGASVSLFATTGGSAATGGGTLYGVTDTSGYNAAPSTAAAATLATAGTNTAFRGIALAPGTAQTVPVATTGAIINEFRTGGPNGAADDFVEIYNQGSTPLDLTGWTLTSNSALVGTIPSGKTIPAYGRLLLTGSTYSLANYGGQNAAAGDVTLSGDVVGVGALLLRNVAGATVDSVSPDALPLPTSPTSDFSFVRRMDGAGGAPQDSGTDASDFNTVDVNSSAGPNNTTGVGSGIQRIGAPGPQNLASPIAANQLVKFTQTTISRTGSGNTGTLIVRGTVQNLSSTRTISALRLRTVGITAGNVTPLTGTPADVRLTSSTSSDGTNLPLSLQVPPTQPKGGGLNATVSLGSPIAPGATVTVEFAFIISKTGTFRYLLNAEPVLTP